MSKMWYYSVCRTKVFFSAKLGKCLLNGQGSCSQRKDNLMNMTMRVFPWRTASYHSSCCSSLHLSQTFTNDSPFTIITFQYQKPDTMEPDKQTISLRLQLKPVFVMLSKQKVLSTLTTLAEHLKLLKHVSCPPVEGK